MSISPEIEEFMEDICWYEPPESETICIKGGSSGILQGMKVRTVISNTTMAIELIKAGGQNLDKRKTYK